MTFIWPTLLWLLLIVPVIVALYILMLRRKNKAALRYASLSMVRQAMGAGAGVRRHVPPILFLMALTIMIAAIARPAAVVTLPSQRSTVILAMDVSGSMRAEDVQPSRFVAAQTAAKAFIADQPKDTRIGIVAFAATALLVQAPTHNREELNAAIDRFQTQRGTAIGSGVLVSLQTLFPTESFEPSRAPDGRPMERRRGMSLDDAPKADAEKKAAAPGSYQSAVIILLTDGQATTGPDPLETARIAADKGVRVYTVGVGSKEGTLLGYEGRSMRVQLDEETLQTMADLTHGQYFRAESAADLKKVYDAMNTQLIMEKAKTEVTAAFSAVAAVLALISVALSMLWFNRII
ncbi:MAG: VWA domain-containing protein [Rhodospirillaceae bacterium]|nr:VWA domain-containing protein [Rhodospirillaceae bacterium]